MCPHAVDNSDNIRSENRPLALQEEDPYHRSYILFLGDRSAKGDPQAYKVPTDDFKKWGQWRKVTAVKRDLSRELFFGDPDNAKKLYTPEGSEATESKVTPYAQPVGVKTAEYVLTARPSPWQLEQWADANLQGMEKLLISKWAALASQTKAGETKSILSHNLDPILEQSAGLEQTLVDHLDMVLGKGLAQPKTVYYVQNNTGQTAGSGGAARDNDDFYEGIKEAITGEKQPKSKLTKEIKETLAGYFVAPWKDPRNKEEWYNGGKPSTDYEATHMV